MRIGVNLQGLRPGEIGGLEWCVRGLVEWIPAVDPEVTLVLFCARYNVETFRPGPGIETHVLSAEEFAALNAETLAGHRLDVWFCPLLTLEPAAPGIPSVVTVPDLQHETYGEFFPSAILEWRREHYPRSVAGADRVLTFSEFSKRQLVELMGAPPERVVPVPLDAAPVFSRGLSHRPGYLAEVRCRHALPAGYFFYPANNWPHKNHRRLFEGLALFRQRGAEPPPLVLTGARVEGGTDWSDDLRRLELEDRVRFLGHVPEEDLPGIYAQAEALVFPSLFEGFGMPLVEAMRSDCPVLCSRSTSLPEVAGEAALYFDPARPEEIFEGMWSLAGSRNGGDGHRRRALIAAGRERARRFSWPATAAATLEVLTELAPPRVEPAIEVEDLPTITVITPSYQQGAFLERTLRSVLEQGYPRLQYVVVDGGSSDESVAILERYRRRYPDTLSYVSERDGGQADAVNKGLALARGEVIGWLNSDDTYAPGALREVGRAFAADEACSVLYGRAMYIDTDDVPIAPYPTREKFDWHTLVHECFLCQPSVFLRRSVVDRGFRLDDRLHSCLDYEFWIRLGREYDFRFLDRYLATSRMYPGNKTIRLRGNLFREVFATVKRHYGFVPPSWALGRAQHLANGTDAFFDRRPVEARAYLLAGLLLLRHNWNRPRYLWRLFRRGDGRRWLTELGRRLRRQLGLERGVASLERAREAWRAGRPAFLGHLAAAGLLVPDLVFTRLLYPRLDRASLGLARRLLVGLGAFVGRHPETTERLASTDLGPDGWAGPRAVLRRESGEPARSLTLGVELPLDYLPPSFSLAISVDGRRLPERRFKAGGELAVDLALDPPLAAGAHTIEVEASAYFVPHRVLRNGDLRPLSWRLTRLAFRP